MEDQTQNLSLCLLTRTVLLSANNPHFRGFEHFIESHRGVMLLLDLSRANPSAIKLTDILLLMLIWMAMNIADSKDVPD
jgi:hypothetical protein